METNLWSLTSSFMHEPCESTFSVSFEFWTSRKSLVSFVINGREREGSTNSRNIRSNEQYLSLYDGMRNIAHHDSKVAITFQTEIRSVSSVVGSRDRVLRTAYAKLSKSFLQWWGSSVVFSHHCLFTVEYHSTSSLQHQKFIKGIEVYDNVVA